MEGLSAILRKRTSPQPFSRKTGRGASFLGRFPSKRDRRLGHDLIVDPGISFFQPVMQAD